MQIIEIGRNDPCPCGSGKKYKKCCAGNDEPVAGLPPAMPVKRPVSQDFVNSLNKTMRLLDAGDTQGALKIAESLVASAPDHEDALYVHGLVHSRMGQYARAEGLLRQAIAKNSYNTRNYLALAEVFHRMDRFAEVQSILATSLSLNPNDPTANRWYGAALLLNGDPEGAIPYFRKAIAQSAKPDTESMEQLYGVLCKTAQTQEAAQVLRTLLSIKPETTVDLRSLFMFPEVAASRAEIAEVRESVTRQAEMMLRKPRGLPNPELSFQIPPFFLAFQGENDRPLLELCARALRACSTELNYTAPHCRNYQGVQAGRKPRIGFVSQYFHKHSVGMYFNHLIAALQASGQVEVTAFSLGGRNDDVARGLLQQCSHFVALPSALAQAQSIVAQTEMDVLIYTDIGMNNASYFLAFSRLAPVQCLMPGHPVTSGLDTVDIYLSCELVEPENAQEHYTEKLVMLPQFVAWGEHPPEPKKPYTKADFGLPDDAHLYFCPMTLQKLHPDFDTALARILELDPKGRIVLVKDLGGPHRLNRLQERLKKNLGAHYERIIFLPWMDPDPFAGAIRLAHVILDPFPFGGGTTFILTCAAGAPFVTLPTATMRGRLGLGVARTLKMPELVASTVEEYATHAVRIATDAAYRERLRQKMLANKAVLYGDTGAAAAMTNLLISLSKPLRQQAGAA